VLVLPSRATLRDLAAEGLGGRTPRAPGAGDLGTATARRAVVSTILLTADRCEDTVRTVLEPAKTDWRTDRRLAARARILQAAKELAAEEGLAGLSLRDLARRLGMAAPSLYGYFDSKLALYDALFAEGYREILALDLPRHPDLRGQLRQLAHAHVRHSLEDPVRAQLLFQRTIPGFEPSPESWALAQQAYDRHIATLLDFEGVTQEDLDLVTAVLTGLVSQQLSNDPGGDRWVRLTDDAVDLLVHRVESRRTGGAS
jgi:AcrR family transcriptional regulator